MAEKLKEMFFTLDSVRTLANVIQKLHSKFDTKRFIKLVFDDEFADRELKAKMRHTTECLRETLPANYKRALGILQKAAPQVKGFEAMCLPDYVEVYGLEEWDLSLAALAVFTRYSSSEFAIRPFIIQDAKRAMAFMKKHARDKDPKVRRFASEGCRPRLPWAMAIPEFKQDPSLILPILEILKNDPSEFVRNSVANNLNDISKDHPKFVLDLCKQWQGNNKNTDWIIKHACRTMLKAGDSRAMILFGFGNPKDIRVKGFTLDKKRVAMGEKVQFTFSLAVDTKKVCKVRLEYMVYFAKANDKTGKKVFKITENTYKPGNHTITRNHSFADLSTRKHYPGEHQISILVNGVEKARLSMQVTKNS
jgi:3-methyladenine DNA glycosylase AlkC